MPGGRYRSLQHPRMYRALRKRGFSKEAAARISNAQTPGHTVAKTLHGGVERSELPDAAFLDPERRAFPIRTARDVRAAVRAWGRYRGDMSFATFKRRLIHRARVLGLMHALPETWRAELREKSGRQFSESNVARDETGRFAEKPGGGGGDTKPEKKKKKKQPEAPEPITNADGLRDQLAATGLDPALAEALSEYMAGQLAAPEDREDIAIARDAAHALAAQGLIRIKPGEGPNAQIELTAAGKKLMKAASAGDVAAAMTVVERGHERAAQVLERERAREAKRQEREAQRAEREAERAARQAMREAQRHQRGGGSAHVDPELLALARQRLAATAGKGWHVYKDRRGAYRWASISSTAYRDNDREIVSREALRRAVALADLEGRRGPLRFWHVPGLELGRCDFQALSADGRVLIESGVFRTPHIAQAIARHKEWQISIGFQHPITEPDADGVFHAVRIFERSLVPPGRAANPMTRFTLKEHMMLTHEKRKALDELLGPELAAALVAEAERTVKAADHAGVTYKDAPAELVINGATYTLKQQAAPAAPPAAPPLPDEPAPEAPALDLGGPEPLTDETDVMDLTVGQLKQVFAEALELVLGGISQKMADMRAQYEAMGKAFGALQTEKSLRDGELAALQQSRDALAQQVQALDARLRELEGDQPAWSGYRASADPATVVATKSASGDTPYANVYRAIFGDDPPFAA